MESKIRYLFLAVVLLMSTMARGQDFNPDDPAEPTDPVAPPVSLVLKASPAEGGTVSGGGKYAIGADVTVKATSNSGFVFVSWTDADGNVLSTTSQYTHKKGPRVETLTANFAFQPGSPSEPGEPTIRPKHYITVTAGEGGTAATSSNRVMEGESVTITATANSGYKFTAWYQADTIVSTASKYTFTMDTADVSFVAMFEKVPVAPFNPSSPSEPGEPTIRPKHYITVTAGEGGTATTSSNRVMEGESVTITATASSGYKFTAWYQADTIVSTASKYTFTMDTADVSFVAMFEKVPVAPFNPSSPSEPGQPSVGKNSLYLMTVAAKPGDTAECVVYFNAVKDVSDMTFQLGFPSGTYPIADSLKVSDRASGYTLSHTILNDSTITVNLTGDTLGVGNIKLLTLSLLVPEDYPVGIGHVITVSQVSVTNPDLSTETASTRNSSLDVYKFGDADNSGVIDIVDLAMARDYLYGVHVDGFEPVAVDLNRNGRVDTDDIQLLTQLILDR